MIIRRKLLVSQADPQCITVGDCGMYCEQCGGVPIGLIGARQLHTFKKIRSASDVMLQLHSLHTTIVPYATKQRPPRWRRPLTVVGSAYFAAVSLAVFALPASDLSDLRRNRSTRPAVSVSFWLPVKNGWQAEQISTTMSPLGVERVSKLGPQAHLTWMLWSFRVIPFFGLDVSCVE